MKIEIKHRVSGAILYTGDHDSMRDAVEAAVKAEANLFGANLFGANLSEANLFGANLFGAYLSDAYLSDANLSRANLSEANLSGITGRICDSHELLAHIAVRFDRSLTPVAAMIAGRLVGCWPEYTDAIRTHFGEDTMRRLWQAWSQDDSWRVVERMREHGWPEARQEEKARENDAE